MMVSGFDCVEDMFRWKLTSRQCKTYQIEPLKHLTVEQANAESIRDLKWDADVDVLYSFLLVYKLGLEIKNNTRFQELKKEFKNQYSNLGKSLNPNSTAFLYFCSQDKEYQELNQNPCMKTFLSLYFTIGNVIPIWPGGNEARGKLGIYDIPELFFNAYPKWTAELIRQYQNININEVVHYDPFFVCSGKERNVYTITELKRRMTAQNQIYYDYLAHRNAIIQKRNAAFNQMF